MSDSSLIHVAAGVLVDRAGRVLLARRHADTHQGGLWEFPGGKLEPGETVSNALIRELQEELGIQVTNQRPLIRVYHAYADCRVLLDVYRVTAWLGKVTAMEGQPLVWVDREDLEDYPMPEADVPLIKAIQLPDTYLITPPVIEDALGFLDTLKQALDGGVSLVQFRVFECQAGLSIDRLASRALQLCEASGARMLVNRDINLAMTLGAHGVHLNGQQLVELERRPLGASQLVAASCHNAEELALADKLGLDFAVLSPVLPTPSHPDAVSLGWKQFASLVEPATLPVYALGGMRPALLETAWQHGAQGIAGITKLR